MQNLKQLIMWVIISLLILSVVPFAPAPVQAQTDTAPVVLWMEGDYWRYYPATGLSEQITTWGWNNFPVISPNNAQIAYSSVATVAVDYINANGHPGGGALPSNIWILDIATGDGVRVADQPAGSTLGADEVLMIRSTPAWSPDGNYLVWTELRTPAFSSHLAIYNTLAGTTQFLPITGQLFGDAAAPIVKTGRDGIAVQDFTQIQATGKIVPRYQIFEFNGTVRGVLVPNAGNANWVDFTWLTNGAQDYIGTLFDDGAWHLLDPKTGIETIHTGNIELVNPLFPNGHKIEAFHQVTQTSGSTLGGYASSPSSPSTLLPNSNARLRYYSVSPTGNSLAYTILGNLGSYIWSNGSLQTINTGGTVPVNVVWGYGEWRLPGGIVGTPAVSQVIQEPVACTSDLPSRLVSGRSAHVASGGANNMRADSDLNAAILLEIPEGSNVSILDGPVCNNSLAWWQVNYNGTVGWTAEGAGIDYWLIPGLNTSPAPNLQGAVLEVTQVGASVTARDGVSRAATEVETLLWGDRVLWTGTKINNQTLSWYEVFLGNGQRVYIEDTGAFTVEDPGYQTPGILVGGTVSVTLNGDGMHLRTSTSTYVSEVASLQQGQTMTVIAGPFYSEYYIWWQFQLAGGATGYAVDVAGWLNPQ